MSAIVAEVRTTHATDQVSSGGSPTHVPLIRFTKGTPTSMNTVGSTASQR